MFRKHKTIKISLLLIHGKIKVSISYNLLSHEEIRSHIVFSEKYFLIAEETQWLREERQQIKTLL